MPKVPHYKVYVLSAHWRACILSLHPIKNQSKITKTYCRIGQLSARNVNQTQTLFRHGVSFNEMHQLVAMVHYVVEFDRFYLWILWVRMNHAKFLYVSYTGIWRITKKYQFLLITIWLIYLLLYI